MRAGPYNEVQSQIREAPLCVLTRKAVPDRLPHRKMSQNSIEEALMSMVIENTCGHGRAWGSGKELGRWTQDPKQSSPIWGPLRSVSGGGAGRSQAAVTLAQQGDLERGTGWPGQSLEEETSKFRRVLSRPATGSCIHEWPVFKISKKVFLKPYTREFWPASQINAIYLSAFVISIVTLRVSLVSLWSGLAYSIRSPLCEVRTL